MEKLPEEKKSGYFDISLIFILLLLLVVGLVMVYSTSSYTSSLNNDGDSYVFLRKQIISTVIGLIGMLVVSFIPHKFYYNQNVAPWVYLFSILSIFLLLTPLGKNVNGATRWLDIFGFTVQPAEFVKIGVILFTAYLIQLNGNVSDKRRNSFKYLFVILWPAGLAALLVYLISSNLSSAIIIAGIAYIMLLVSSPKCYKAYILGGILVAIAVVVVVILYVKVYNSSDVSDLNYRFERILAWFNPERYADGKGFQTLQALYGIGSGGTLGKGLGKSMQKLGFLPEAYNDMIFSVICEELGLFGAFFVMILFILLLFRIVDIARYIESTYGLLLMTGVFAHLAIQVILNIAVVTNTIPNTGISLPFISYGGSAVIFTLCEMGLVLNVSKYYRKKDKHLDEKAD